MASIDIERGKVDKFRPFSEIESGTLIVSDSGAFGLIAMVVDPDTEKQKKGILWFDTKPYVSFPRPTTKYKNAPADARITIVEP